MAQIERLFSGAMPGRMVSAVVSIEHCGPIVASVVVAHGIAKEKSVSTMVPGAEPAG